MARPSELPALRVVLDTQVLLRGAVARTESLTSKIYDAWREGRFTLLLSEPIAAEVEEVLLRPEVLQKLHLNPVEARARFEQPDRAERKARLGQPRASEGHHWHIYYHINVGTTLFPQHGLPTQLARIADYAAAEGLDAV